jgi:hypothetical protein
VTPEKLLECPNRWRAQSLKFPCVNRCAGSNLAKRVQGGSVGCQFAKRSRFNFVIANG